MEAKLSQSPKALMVGRYDFIVWGIPRNPSVSIP